jgi:tetratricopeptide (TPR) repeat protein/predicted Ser/Thr protein kinase
LHARRTRHIFASDHHFRTIPLASTRAPWWLRMTDLSDTPDTQPPTGDLSEEAAGSWNGRRIGPYRVLRELGRGGMGVVYLAERCDGQFEQRVALKLIKRGMDSDEIHRRFLTERQILARLNHPHIARLLDGGVTIEGRPWFAIEYIEGTTLLAHCETRDLDLEARLRLFLDVCDAVRYAHQNLVVHRDLKPSNILVTAEGEVNLLDFGIAKLLSPDSEAATRLTETGFRVLTPEYAAPEQVRGEAVTTATDVYALGAVLYELVSGQQAHRLESRSPMHVAWVVCEVDPERPSLVASEATRERLRGDVDTIVLTALQKEPGRRYSTVEQLASDIKRYLDGLPVSARPDTWRYRASKFVARHRLGVAAATGIAFSLVAGLVGTGWQARVAAGQARVASAEAAKQRAVRDFLVQLFEASDPEEAMGHELTARELLERGRRSLDTALAAQPSVRADLLTAVAAAYVNLGHAPQGDTLFARAVALTRSLPGDVDVQLATALTDWSGNLMMEEKFDQAEAQLQEAIERLRRRGTDDPRVAQPLRMLGRLNTYKGNNQRAEALIREALAIDRRHHGAGSWEVADDSDILGFQLLQEGHLSAADSAIGVALTTWRRLLPPDHPTLLWSMSNLAAVRTAQGNNDEAIRLLQDVAAGQRRIYPGGHSELAHTLTELGDLLGEQGRYAEAESLTAQAVELHRSLLGPDNSHATMLLENLADFRYHMGKLGPATHDMRQVLLTWWRTRGPDDRRTLWALNELGVYMREQGRYGEAATMANEALTGRRKVLGDSSPQVARSLRDLALARRGLGKRAEAEQLLRDALAIDRKSRPLGDEETTRVLSDLGAVLNERRRPKDAEPLLREALTAKNPPLGARRELGYSLALQGRYPEAEQLLGEAEHELAKRDDYLIRKEKREILRRLAEVRRMEGHR